MFLPKPTEGGDFAPPPAGLFAAICYRFVDLGTQQGNWQGKTTHYRKVMLSWEITDPDERMDDGRPWTISQRYTWSMSEKAQLRKVLESWRGKAFSESDFGDGGFDTKNLIGAPCMLNLVHAEKDGKVYTNIGAITKVPKGMASGELVNEPLYFSIDDFRAEQLSKLSDNLQATIKSSPEYQALGKPKNGTGYVAPHFEAGDPGFSDEDVPF